MKPTSPLHTAASGAIRANDYCSRWNYDNMPRLDEFHPDMIIRAIRFQAFTAGFEQGVTWAAEPEKEEAK